MDRYIRHNQLEGFGPDAQRRLADATVLIVGAGALGTAAAMPLAASGVGHIRVVDFDSVDITNLQRQLAFTEGDVGKPKAESLAAKLRAINSSIDITPYCEKVSPSHFEGVDLVVEASDNPTCKYFVTDTCQAAGIPYVFGGIAQWRGQAMCWAPGHVGYRSIYPEGTNAYLPASRGGVLGPLPPIIGAIEATEAIKILSGAGTPRYDSLLLLDARTLTISQISLA